jgi:hypothetical protein
MENRLKADILAESELCNGQILVTDENDDFTTFNLMIQATPETVKTPKEVFLELLDEGYKLEYNRIPITDEKVCSRYCGFHYDHSPNFTLLDCTSPCCTSSASWPLTSNTGLHGYLCVLGREHMAVLACPVAEALACVGQYIL